MGRITHYLGESLLVGIGVAALGLSGCGIGTVAVMSSSSDDDPVNSDPVVSDASITETRTSPATIRFQLTDAESDPVNVELLYQLSGGTKLPMLLTGQTNLQNLAASSNGVFHTRYWDFAAQLPGGGAYEQGVSVTVRRTGSADELSSTVSGATIGNDAPDVLDPRPRLDPETQEARGLVLVDMLVADSSGDVVDLKVEFQGPDGVWQKATYSLGDHVPPIQATPTGRDFTFLWDSDIDGAEAEWTTSLRFTASDDTHAQEPVVTQPFAVDNNREPIAALGEPIDNPDRSGAIAVSYRIIDEESDPTPVVFQWRRPGESFPDLPPSMAELLEVLQDPEARRLHHVCTEAPTIFRGRVAELPEGSDPAATLVRLPELASSAASLVPPGLSDQQIDILRRSSSPRPVKDSWTQDLDLRAPVAVLPIGDGIAALVLDGEGGGWNLRVIELATGRSIYTLVNGVIGTPLTMTYEAGRYSVLVACTVGDSWQLYRVDPLSGLPVLLVSSANGNTEVGAVRGLVSLGDTAALLTVGSSLVRVDYAFPLTPRATTLVDGLQTPWGIVLDPLHRNRIYLAERDYDPGPPTSGAVGRVLALELDTHDGSPVVAWEFGGEEPHGLPRPQALSIERSGARLLAVTDRNTSDGTRELRSVDLGGERLGETVELGSDLPTQLGEMSGLGVGPEGLRLLTLEAGDDLAVGGGVLQSRTVIAVDPDEPDQQPYDPAAQVLTVGVPFDPRPEAGDPWRIVASAPVASSSPTGVSDVFVWDSADLSGGGEVFLRVTPLGLTDVGVASESAIHKVVDHLWVADPLILEVGLVEPQSISTGDLNGDGLLDLVCTDDLGDCYQGQLSIFFQNAPGEFSPSPDLLLQNSIANPNSVAVSDLNGDGKQDIVCANGYCGQFTGNDRLVIFYQSGAGSFGPGPDQVLVLGNVEQPADPHAVEAADLNGDGLLDLCSANTLDDNLTIFYQVEPGYFSEEPELLGDVTTTDGPHSIAVADLNGDGKPDLVSANSVSNTLTIFHQGAARTFGAAPDVTIGDFTSLDDPRSVVAADLNGDGLLDLTVANFDGDDLVVFMQPADGFVDTVTPDLVLGNTGLGSRPLFVDAADLDGDGRLDLISANNADDNLHLYLQEVSGDFPSSSPLILGSELTTSEPQSVRAADLNGDGRLDLVSASAGTGNLTVFFQTVSGDYATEPDLAVGDANTIVDVVSVAAADLNGDRLLDILTADSLTGHLTIFSQAAPGVFSTVPELVLGADGTLDRPRYVTLADLSGDGRLDVVAANFRGDNLAVFFQTVSGSYDEHPDLLLGDGSSVDGPECVAAADLTGDGRFDLVSANTMGDNLAVFLQDATGDFPSNPSYVLGDVEVTRQPGFVIALDLDGDGLGDVVSANKLGGHLSLFFQNTPGGFSGTPDLQLGYNALSRPVGLAAADLNGDGLLDLVSSNSDAGSLTVWFQTEPRHFSSTPLVLDGPGSAATLVSLSAADLNEDGQLDVVAADLVGSQLVAYLQIAPGIFNGTPHIVVGGRTSTQDPRFLVTADLNGDGSLDLVTRNRASRELTIFLNR